MAKPVLSDDEGVKRFNGPSLQAGGTMPAVRDILRHARHQIEEATGSDEAELDAELLMMHVLGIDRVHLFQRLEEGLGARRGANYEALVRRRLAREPTAYIVGHKEFFGRDFEVTPAALIPRPETETLVELALGFARERFGGRAFVVADVGTGSGIIGVTLACELPNAGVIATEVSPEPLELAARNAARHGVSDRMSFAQGDLLQPLSAHPEVSKAEPTPGEGRDSSRGVDLIAANLPYVKTADWDRLPPEIRAHEPRGALDGGADGLREITRLLEAAPRYLQPAGALFAEIGDEHGEAVTALARRHFPDAKARIEKDLTGRDRVLAVETSLPAM